MQDFDTSSLSLRNLRLLIEVFDAGSVSEGALRVSLTQSSASHALDKLRESLGDPLFVRVGRNVVPTDFLQAIMPGLRRAMVELEAVLKGDELLVAPGSRPITIAANTIETLPALRRIRTQLEADVPGVSVRFLDIGGRENALPILAAGKTDMVLMPSFDSYPLELKAETLYRDRFVCFRDPAFHKPDLTIDDYVALSHATIDFGGDRPSIVENALSRLHLQRSVTISAANAFVLRGLMSGTPMVATLPRFLIQTAFDGFGAADVPFDVPELTYDMVWHRRATHSRRHLWLAEVVRTAFDL